MASGDCDSFSEFLGEVSFANLYGTRYAASLLRTLHLYYADCLFTTHTASLLCTLTLYYAHTLSHTGTAHVTLHLYYAHCLFTMHTLSLTQVRSRMLRPHKFEAKRRQMFATHPASLLHKHTHTGTLSGATPAHVRSERHRLGELGLFCTLMTGLFCTLMRSLLPKFEASDIDWVS